MRNRILWDTKNPRIATGQDCDEVHITRDTLTIFYDRDKKEVDLSGIHSVTFFPKSSHTLSSSADRIANPVAGGGCIPSPDE